MTRPTCEEIRDLLVDYADHELCDTDSMVVQNHLHVCAVCRAELSDLQRSLELAQAVWRQSAAAVPTIATSTFRARSEVRRALVIAAALSAVAAGAWLLWNPLSWDKRDPPQRHVVGHERRRPAAEPPVDMSEITSLIAHEAQSARLAASSQLLAVHPSLADYSQHADTYLATAYENSRAGVQAKRRLAEPPASSDTGTDL